MTVAGVLIGIETAFIASGFSNIMNYIQTLLYGLMLTIAGFFTSAEERAKAADININLWLGIFMLLLGIFFLIWARLSPQKPPEPNLTGTDRPMMHH